MSLVDKVSIVWCLQKQFIYSFLIMSNKLTKRFSIIVTKSWNSRTNCCLVYLSVHMCDAEKKVGVWYIFSILPLGSWAHMKSRRVSITDHSFHTLVEWRHLLFLSDAVFFYPPPPLFQKGKCSGAVIRLREMINSVKWRTGLVWNFSHLLEVQ